MTHTPGPWTTAEATKAGHVKITGPGFNGLVAVAGNAENNPRQFKANANLIAAAPDLLDALTAVVFQVCQGKVLERDACIAQARAAIARATT